MDNRLTDNEIIKALECCKDLKCSECPKKTNLFVTDCDVQLCGEVLDIINCQQAEIERYKGVIKILEKDVAAAKDDAIKEFGHMLIDKAENGYISVSDIPDYVQEMVGDTV